MAIDIKHITDKAQIRIVKNIYSCTNPAQLNACQKMIDSFVEYYKDIVDAEMITMIKESLEQEITDKRIQFANQEKVFESGVLAKPIPEGIMCHGFNVSEGPE